jgi:hypothetical protein
MKARVFVLLAACVTLSVAANWWDGFDEPDEEMMCNCAEGWEGTFENPYPCNHMCMNAYRCHLDPRACPVPGETCERTDDPNDYQFECRCTTEPTECGENHCGEIFMGGCPENTACTLENEEYFCKSTCTPDCTDKACGAADGCGGRCSTGSCKNKKDTCGGGGVEFECGRPKGKSNVLTWVVGVICSVVCGGSCAGGIIYVKRRQRKTLVPAGMPDAEEATACVEVETDEGASME